MINAAHATGRGQFCIALCELEYDDPFSALLDYDESLPQPWSRTDIAREIYSVTAPGTTECIGSRFAALSNEGDVCWVGDQTSREKILGAGVQSPDASGAGGLAGLGLIEGQLWAVGHGAQIYRRSGSNRWDKIPFAETPKLGFEVVRFGRIVSTNIDDIYVSGVSFPMKVKIDKKPGKSFVRAEAGMTGTALTNWPGRTRRVRGYPRKDGPTTGTAKPGQRFRFQDRARMSSRTFSSKRPTRFGWSAVAAPYWSEMHGVASAT